jgi:cysteinyl-tRNA synthetase
VLFSVPSHADYGELSRRNRDDMIAGARVEVAPYKRDPADFVMWKPAVVGTIGWDSPWGRGRPGWHIECSAMIQAHLGETVDIHGGGIDLIFPHHENEIAQSRCAHAGAPLARYWVHNGFVDMGADKMSKSLGNVVTPEELLHKDSRGEIFRFALLKAHYRQPLAWNDELIAQSVATLDRLYQRGADAEPSKVDAGVIDALSEDLNTPLAFSRLLAIRDKRILRASAQFLGFLQMSLDEWRTAPRTHHWLLPPTLQSESRLFAPTVSVSRSDDQIWQSIGLRQAAKKAKDFATADRIRDELKAEGIILEDGPDRTTWRRA